MQRDIRDTAAYQNTKELYNLIRQPGTGRISDVNGVHPSPDGKQVVFVGTIADKLEETPSTRLCITDLKTGGTQIVAFEKNCDRMPKFSPNGAFIAFLSDRKKEGDFQLYLLDVATGTVKATPAVDGWIEYLHWSPDGLRVLLGVAGHGADVAGGQGAVTSKKAEEKKLPSWTPVIETGNEDFRWRSVWVHTLATDTVHRVSKTGSNIWESVWCGPDAIAAIVSPSPSEAMWYTATLNVLDLECGAERVVYQPKDQLGAPAATPSGDHLAVIEAVCSDRGVVAGELLLIDLKTNEVQSPDTGGVDITYTEWRSEERLLLAGHRSFETVIGEYDKAPCTFTETWASREISSGNIYATVAAVGRDDCVLSGEGFLLAPEIALIRNGDYCPVVSFDNGYKEQVNNFIGPIQPVSWPAPDGQQIQGWVLQPQGEGPHPLVMTVHGGPVWHSRPRWLGRMITTLMLLKLGYAIFQPNPRGSSGRGKDFARLVYGDMGGAEIQDHLSGIDYLVEQGIADPLRLGVTGGSHGGFIASHIITQDQRFAAAVPLSPVTDWVSQHLTSNISYFDALVLGGSYKEGGGRYFDRSPVMHAHKVNTPTLSICGALDRCTPAGQAMEFHNALLEHGVKSVLATYPEEGHGVRKLPAAIDFATRVVTWFEQHMPVEVSQG